jgi:protein-tyrosine phosphatase
LIDLHCHILPGLDDGAQDAQDSIAMARQAQEDGVSSVCATPHLRDDHDVRIEEISARVQDLQQLVDAEGVPVRILPGGELAQERAEHLSERELSLATLGGGGRWLLLEPAPGPLASVLFDAARRLMQSGFAAVVAHPERHADALLEDRLAELAGIGCLVQWTAEFVAHAADDDLVLQMARKGLVHLLGSDAHSARAGRPVRLASAFVRLSSVCSAERLRWIADEAPRAIVSGDLVAPAPP